jgi:hypothetical protein
MHQHRHAPDHRTCEGGHDGCKHPTTNRIHAATDPSLVRVREKKHYRASRNYSNDTLPLPEVLRASLAKAGTTGEYSTGFVDASVAAVSAEKWAMSDRQPARTCKRHPGIPLPPSRTGTGCCECKRESRTRSREKRRPTLTIEQAIHTLKGAMTYLKSHYHCSTPACDPRSGTLHSIVAWVDGDAFAAHRFLQSKLTRLCRKLRESERKGKRPTLA